MSKESYIAGFTKVAEAHGIDPAALMKIAQATTKGTGPRLGGSALTSEQALGKMKVNATPLTFWERFLGAKPYSGSIEFSRSYINSPHSSPRLYNSSLDVIQAKPVELSNEIARKAREGKNADPAHWKHPLGSTPVDRPFDSRMAREGIIGRDTSLFEANRAAEAARAAKSAKGVKGVNPRPMIPWIKRVGSILKKAR
jgi:hypothetical protein